MKDQKPIIATSSCLLGENVRYNRSHRRNQHIASELSESFSFFSFCPEMMIGLGVPRKEVTLIKDKEEIKLVNSDDHLIDHTEILESKFHEIKHHFINVSGFILASKSPSCGLGNVGIFDKESKQVHTGNNGAFAQMIENYFPLVPKISSGKLYNDKLREVFVEQTMTYSSFYNEVVDPKTLLKFHQQHKYYLMQYGPAYLKKLGRICAGVTKASFERVKQTYEQYLFGVIFKKDITTKNRTNVLEHIAGYFKKDLTKSEKKHLHEVIKSFYLEKMSYHSAIELLNYLTVSYDQSYLKDQVILRYSSRKCV